MKRYTLKVGEVFTQEKADELIEYFSAITDDLRKIQWNGNQLTYKPHIWDMDCKCDACLKNTEIEEVINNINHEYPHR